MIFIFLPLFFITQPAAQSAELNLIGSAGQGQSLEVLDVQWSVGETVIGPFDSAEPATHGFHQLIIEEITGIDIPELLSGIQIQKKEKFLQIVFGKTGITFEVGLYNLKAERLRHFTVSKNQEILDIPLKYFTPGLVILKITTDKGKLARSFKLIRGEGQ